MDKDDYPTLPASWELFCVRCHREWQLFDNGLCGDCEHEFRGVDIDAVHFKLGAVRK